jgi:hypothetical protein
MKTKMIAILMVVLVSSAWAVNKQSDDYWQFEKWLQYVHQEAPRHHLKLQWGEPTQEEFFYLYCWQSADHSIVHAVQKAKQAWQLRSGDKQPLWGVSYVCYVNGKTDSIGFRFVTAPDERAAAKEFHRQVFGEKCRVTAVERSKEPFTHRPLFQ